VSVASFRCLATAVLAIGVTASAVADDGVRPVPADADARVEAADAGARVEAADAGGRAAPESRSPRIPGELLPAPSLIEALRRAGLIGEGVDPVPRFAWTLETKRPLRDPKLVSERFLGSPSGGLSGLSPMMRSYSPQPPAVGSGERTVLSVRGLATVHPGESQLGVSIEGLQLPLRDGAGFRLDWSDDGGRLEQRCRAGAREPAAALNPALPGEARRIDCEGEGRYKGIPVGVSTTVYYLERLGVFLQAENTIRSPLGPLRSWTRIRGFSMP